MFSHHSRPKLAIREMWLVCASTVALLALVWSARWLWPLSRQSLMQETIIGQNVMRISETLHIDFRDPTDDRVVLSASLGVTISRRNRQRILCRNEHLNVSCMWDEEGNRVQITVLPTLSRLKCTNFVWVAVSYKDVLKDCFRLRDAHWYGGGVHSDQTWPIEKVVRKEAPFVTGDFQHKGRGHLGGVGERFWLSSKVAAIVVNPSVPLFVSLNQSNDGRLCLVGKNGPPYRNTRRAPPTLDYTVCVGRNMVALYRDVYKMFYAFPVDIPDEHLLVNPIWSTWSKSGSGVSQTKVERLAFEIDEHEFPRGTISIGDKWEYCYGDLVFDSARFPDPAAMMRKLASQGFRVALLIHPFSSRDCATYTEGLRRNYWVTGPNRTEMGRVGWWNASGGLVDVTNTEAVEWWIGRVGKLRTDYGVKSFRFVAGESTWLPLESKLTAVDDAYPNVYTTRYAEAIAAHLGRSVEVRVGYRTQHLPILLRMAGKKSVWSGGGNGLRTIIPTALHFGLMGYPFVLPDTVGGNEPSRELLARWLQLNVFLPALEFSVVPWSRRFDERLVRIAKKALKLRARFAPLILTLAREASRSGTPIVRPLWWIAPTDQITHDIDDQFMVGDTLLVAPILDPGKTQRHIYLPKGFWYDEIRDTIHRGPAWLENYKVSLAEIAFFVRIPKPTVNRANRLY